LRALLSTDSPSSGTGPAAATLAVEPGVATAFETVAPARADSRRRRLLVRACEAFPAAFALSVITILVIGPFWFPQELLIAVLLFEGYWLWRSWTIGFHALKGVGLMRDALETDWRAVHAAAGAHGPQPLPWNAVRHVVIVPNYGESTAKLRTTLQTLAASPDAATAIIPVLAMEAAEDGSEQKGRELADEFAGRFLDVLVTLHPRGLPGEVRGKSSNEAWAARRAFQELIGRRGFDLDHLTVTSCDADTQFSPSYFEALTCYFATDPARYRRFWQAPIFFYNNIWHVPAALRIPNALSGLIHLGKLSRRRRVLFPQSTYSLSLRLAHEVGYWDVDVIPEDWHMFMKCHYLTGGDIEVEPIMIPLGNDGALSSTPWQTMLNHYLQVRRWGWGASDIPYAVTQALDHPEIPLHRRFLRCWYLVDNHISWSTQWFAVTLGSLLTVADRLFGWGLIKPDWYFLTSFVHIPLAPGWLTLSTLIMTPCLLPYLVLVVLDVRLRPAPPPDSTRLSRFVSHAWWLASSPITLIWSALPALDAQVRLLLGKRMDYRVTEKV
jgi:hypothetical protein